jgi:plastocyanin
MNKLFATVRWRVALPLAILASAAHAAPVTVQVADAQGQPIAGAVVFLESPAAARAVKPLERAEVVQTQRKFVPAVSVVTLGTAVQFPNLDSVRHHVYSLSPTKRFELKLYIGKPESPVVFDKAGVAVLGCNIHDQMVGWVVIVETPYYARTGDDGRAVIDAAGSYRLRTWHTDLAVGAPALDQALTVAAAPVAAMVNGSKAP